MTTIRWPEPPIDMLQPNHRSHAWCAGDFAQLGAIPAPDAVSAPGAHLWRPLRG